jgi:predicted acyl esterase
VVVPRGYACMRLDSRGAGRSPGKSEPSSLQEALDTYDAIEWVAKREWCSGCVGMMGISYHASSQWRAANLQPPSLKCIMPWEGRADQYRDQAYHGGIFAMGFIGNWWLTHTAHHLLGRPRSYNPDAFHNDMLWNYMRNDLDSNTGVEQRALGQDHGAGLQRRQLGRLLDASARQHRGLRERRFEETRSCASHTGTHFHPFHSEEGRMDQLRWFDYWLKGHRYRDQGRPAGEARDQTGGSLKPYAFRSESEWPLARTQWTKTYLRIDSRDFVRHPWRAKASSRARSRQRKESSAISASGATKAGIASGSSLATTHGNTGRTGVSFESAPSLTTPK